MEKILTGTTTFGVSVNAAAGLITLQTAAHSLANSRDLGFNGRSTSTQDAIIKFKIEFSDDAKTIRLVSIGDAEPTVLSCDNCNYLKLICMNADAAFSLSLSSLNARIMKFRS